METEHIFEKWIEMCQSERSITKHQIDGFNYLVDHGIPYIIDKLNPFKVKLDSPLKVDDTLIKEIHMQVGQENGIRIEEPRHSSGKKMFPDDARQTHRTYLCKVIANVYFKFIDEKGNNFKSIERKDILIGEVPVLLMSKVCNLSTLNADQLIEYNECPHDQGGYFIVDGREKVIVSRERVALNQFLFIKGQTVDPFLIKAESRCLDMNALFPREMRITMDKHKEIYVRMANHNIKIFHLFRLLGIESDREIISFIADRHDQLNSSILNILRINATQTDDNMIYTRDSALKYYKILNAEKIQNDLFPNVLKISAKLRNLGLVVNKLIKKFLSNDFDHRDNFRNKRVHVSGRLLFEVFRDRYNILRLNAIKQIKESINRANADLTKANLNAFCLRYFNLESIFDSRLVSDALKKSFKGNWGLLNDRADMFNFNEESSNSFVQDLNRLSYISYVSHVRELKPAINIEGTLTSPHLLGSEQYGFICPLESPDGANVGLIKHMSIGCIVSTETPVNQLELILKSDQYFIESNKNIIGISNVYINHTLYGFHSKPLELLNKLQNLKRNHEINYQVTFYYDFKYGEIHIFCDSGRLLRPLIIIDGSNIQNSFKKNNKKWFEKGFLGTSIEYVEVNECNHLMIARGIDDIIHNPKNISYTHCEIAPEFILGFQANSVPFLNHNPTTRGVFGCQQSKQAIGVFSTTFRTRNDNKTHILSYPQKPIVTTKLANLISKEQLPNGQTLIVAIASHLGYNQEDAIILNKDSVDRGLLNTFCFKSIDIREDDVYAFKIPEMFKYDSAFYRKLDGNGLPKKDVFLSSNEDVLIARTKHNEDDTIEDDSVVTSDLTSGFVETVTSHVDDSSKLNVKITTRNLRKPTLGDKLASVHGQKGVVGLLLRHFDMPFDSDGTVPDIIVNPFAFPKRMTLGQILEMVFTSFGIRLGCNIEGSSFQKQNLEECFEYLERNGFDRHCNKILYNSRTGGMMTTEIFMAPTYFLRLKHMVQDKISYRNISGATDSISQQPLKGRSNQGGLRLGEMEVNSIIAHGSQSFLREALMHKSDGKITSKGCRKDNIVSVDGNLYHLPRAFEVLNHELNSMSIQMKLS